MASTNNTQNKTTNGTKSSTLKLAPKGVVTKNPVQEKNNNASEAAKTILLPTGTNKPFRVKLGQLVSLKKTYIDKAGEAIRPLKQPNLESLILTNETLPPITVQASNQGFIIIDGYHRYNAAIAKARVAFYKPDQTAEDFDILEFFSKLPAQTNEEKAFVDQQTIMVIAVSCKDEFDLLQRAYTANFKHGERADTKDRAKYAFWLYTYRVDHNIATSLRKCAIEAGVTHQAVMHYRDSKLGKKEVQAKIVKELESNTKLTPEAKKQEIAAIEQRNKAAEDEKNVAMMVTRLRAVYKIVGNFEKKESVDYLKNYFKVEDAEMLLDMSELLNELSQHFEQQIIDAKATEDDEEDEDYEDDEDENYED